MKHGFVLLVIVLLAGMSGGAGASFGESYTFITAEELNERLITGFPMILIDVCPADQFAKGHIKGAIETDAYPVRTEAEKSRLAKQLTPIRESAEDVVVICPRGGGARDTVDYFRAQGVPSERLLILINGMEKWPYGREKK
jgi:rhodanese-related sulfurtransferase